MKKFFQGRQKTSAAKVLMGVMALFFLLQTQPLFCACLAEGTSAAAMASSTLPMKSGMPMKGCPCKGNDSDPQKADHGPCPLCHGLNTCSPEEQNNTFMVSPANSFTGWMVPATFLPAAPSLATVQFIPNRGPFPGERPDRPILLMKNSFLF